MTLNVTIWNEFRHEKVNEEARKVYPGGLHAPIADLLRAEGMTVRAATLDESEHGLTEAVLAETDVLTWWGHMAHHEVGDEIVARVQKRVLDGMGLIVLHSGHHSKIFKRLMGTTCDLIWREANERERIWVVELGHPIAAGLGPYFEIAHEELDRLPFHALPNPLLKFEHRARTTAERPVIEERDRRVEQPEIRAVAHLALTS